MEKTLLSKILDNLFLIFTVFVVSFLWIRYYEHNTFLILLFSSLITFFVCSVFYFVNKKNNTKKEISIKECKNIDSLTSTLMFSSQAKCLSFFEQTLQKRNIIYTKNKTCLVFEHNVIRPCFNKIEVDDNALLEIILEIKAKKIKPKIVCVCAKKFTDNAKKLASSVDDFNLLLYDNKQTYCVFFKPLKIEIEQKPKKETKLTFKQKVNALLGVAFNKKRFKSYFLSAIVLFIASYFMRYNIYYLCFSSILIVFAFFSYFNQSFNRKEKNLFGE